MKITEAVKTAMKGVCEIAHFLCNKTHIFTSRQQIIVTVLFVGGIALIYRGQNRGTVSSTEEARP